MLLCRNYFQKAYISKQKIPFIHLSSVQYHLLRTGATNKWVILLTEFFPLMDMVTKLVWKTY